MTFFYHAHVRVDGFLWYHFRSLPTSEYYVGQVPPVIHNYGFTLALAGFIVDPDVGYASLYNVTKYKKPIDLFKKYGVYAYPLAAVKPMLGEYTMAAQCESLATYRGRTRLAYPIYTRNVMLMPGSELRTLIVSKERLPDKLVVNIGAKRAGLLSIRLKEVDVEHEEGWYVTHPFNLADVVEVSGYTILVAHKAGDIAIFGLAKSSYVYTVKERGRELKVVAPALNTEV